MSLLYDQDGNLKDELFSSVAESKATELRRVGERKNTNSQIRQFYDEFVKYNDKVKRNKLAFTTLKPLIQMLKAKAAYAKGREVVDDVFYNFISDLVSAIKTPDDLNNATTFFEAVIAFNKMKEKEKNTHMNNGQRSPQRQPYNQSQQYTRR